MSLSNLQNLSTLALDGLTTIQVDTLYIGGTDVNSLYVPYTGATKNVNLSNQNLDTTGVITTSTLNATTGNITNMVNNNLTLMNGNTATTNTKNQITFGYNNTVTYRHAIKTKHNGSADDSGNAFEFYLWKVADGSGAVGTNKVLVISSAGVDAGANKITTTYVPVNDADLINKLYLTTNNYTKTQTDTLLNAKANLSGANFTGVVDMGANKISSSYIPAANADLINLLYLTTNNYTKTQTDNLLNSKANLSGANFTGAVDMGANKISSSYVPAANADLINLLYLTTNYYTKTNIDNNFYTKTQSDANYYSKTYIDTLISSYYTKTQIDTNIYTKTQSDANYYSKTYIDTLISSYYTKTQIDTTFTNYYTKTNIDTTLTNYYTKTNIDTNIYTKTQSDANYYSKASTDTLLNAKANLSGAVFTGAVSMGANKITATYTPSATSDLTTKTYVDTQDALKANLSGASFSGNVSTSGTFIGKASIRALDLRNVKPSDLGAGYLTFHFGSYPNNGGSSYSDCIHFNTYIDASGGGQNLLMLLKNGIGLRIYQGAFGSTTAYSSYKDALLIDSSNNINASINMGANKITATYTPSATSDLTTKSYVDTQDALKVSKAGDTMTGTLDMGANKITATYTPSATSDLTTKSYVDTQDALKVSKAGDTMTGTLDMGANKITTTYAPVNTADLTNKNYVDTAITTSKTNLLSGINTWTAGQIFNVGLTSNGNLDVGSNRAICNRVPTFNDDLTNKLYIDNSFVTFATYYYNKTTTDSLLNAKANLSGASFTGDVSTSGTFIGNVKIKMLDQRTLKPSDLSPGYITCGFSTFGNGTWSDFIHFNSYWDGSGGNQNVLMLSKGGINMRIYQGGFGDTTAYTIYKDAILIDNTNTINFNTLLTSSALNINTTNTQNTNIGNTTGTLTLNNASLGNTPQVTAFNNKVLTLNSSNKIEYVNMDMYKIFNINGVVWGPGIQKLNAFTKTHVNQKIYMTGSFTLYTTVANSTVSFLIRFNVNGVQFPTYTNINTSQYINPSYSHTVIPVSRILDGTDLPISGNIDVFVYVTSANTVTDMGDVAYLNIMVLQ